MTSEYIAPLNLKYIFVNVLAGSQGIFLGLAFIAMCVLAGLFKMPERTFLLMVILSSILLYNWFGAGLYILVLLLVGATIYWAISKMVK